jgi:ribosome-associated heat shock protein Hsp15
MNDALPRLDKWLWYARFFKSRSLASALCQSGKARISGGAVTKAHQRIKVGDVVTFPQGHHIRVVRILALATRRGPASEAQQLYEDLSPPKPENRLPDSHRRAGTGRPTKRERRRIDVLRSRDQ